jgi:hypothetical protein
VTPGLLLIRRLRPVGEPAALQPMPGSEAATLEGTAGAGRIVHALADAGVGCDPIVQLVLPAAIEVDDLRRLAAGDFETVALGSHLVNLPDEGRRDTFVDLAVRHVGAEGSLVLEHHPVDWGETAADVEPTPGSAVGMEGVQRDPPFVSAVSVFDVGGRIVRQPFTARVLSERDVAEVLARTGLRVVRRLSPTLIEARRGA